MASTNGSGSNAKKAAFEAAYAALKAGKQPSQAEINKIYNQALNQTSQNTGTSVQNTHYSAVDKSTEWGNYSTVAKKPTASTTQNVHYSVANNWIDQKKNQPGTSTTQQEDSRTTKQKYDDAKKAYDDYIGSDERAQKVKDMNKVSLQDAMSRMFNVSGGPSSDALMGSGYMQSAPEDTKEKELSATVEHYRQQLQKEEDQRIMDADLKELESWSEEDRNNLDRYIAERDQHAYNALNPMLGTQFDTYNLNPIVEKYGVGKVRQMAESLQRNQNAETTAKAEEAAKNTANKRPWLGGTLGSLASVGANLAGAYTGPLGYAVETGQRTGRYSTLDPNNIGNLPSVYGETVRSEVAQNIRGDEESTNWLRNLAAFGYQGGMSALDSAARIAASGGSAGISSAIAASGAFSNGLRQYSQQGASPEQAAAMALADAGLEYITEKLPTEKVLSVFKKGNTKNAVREVLTQAFLVEPTSEEVNLFAGVAAEALILGDKNSKSQQVGELIANGMSYEEAKAQVYKELWNEALQTYAVSAFSGLASSGGAAIIGNAVNGNQQQETPQQDTPADSEAIVTEQPQNFVEATGEQLAQQMPKPEEPAPLTEGQQHLENAVAKLLGVNDEHKNTASNEAAIMQNQDESTFESEKEVKGTGAAEQNFSGKAQYQDLLFEGNVQRDRSGDVRPMEVPKTDTYERNVSEFVGNAYGAAVTSDKMANEIESLVQEGALGFDRRSNQDALNDAAKEIEAKGSGKIRNQITRNIANGKLSDGDIEKAMLLYSNFANKNGTRAQESAAELLVDLTTMAHMTGRNLQLFKLLRRMTPEGQLMAINQTVQRNVENMKRTGQVKKDYHAQLDPQLIQEYEKAAKENARAVSQEQKEASAEKMQEIQQAIFAAEAAKMPATFKAKWDAWRYMSMLGNAKTQVRNLVGNLAFMPYKVAKDKMAAAFEKALPKEQRTKAIGTDFGLLSWAKADAKSTDVKNALKYSAKLGDDVTSAQFAENKKVFDSKALDGLRKIVEKVPQAGDMIFKNDYYARSLASFLKARGYNAEAINSGNVSDAVLAEARGYAIQEAMKATFNDCNAFSDAIASIGRKNTDNAWSKALNVAAEGILPFRRTPANIAVRFTEYSPAGLIKGVWDMATKVRSGDLSAAAAIDEISAGLTGTGIMALGFFLAKGIGGVKITGSGTDEDEKRQGHQDYAVEFSIDGQEYSYKIDWAAPANLPLFVGANIYKAMEEAGANTDVSSFTSILHGMGTMFEPMLALSCMSSLNDLVEGIRYAPEGEALYSVAADIATSYFMQGIPALARQTYQATQENKQTTFANSDDATIRDLQKIGAQVPFLGSEVQTDKRNAWGETEDMGSPLERTINAFLNPGTAKMISNDAVEKELNRLKEAQTENVSPRDIPKKVSYTDKNGQDHKDVRLTEEQYQAMAQEQGQTAKKVLDQLIASEDYKALTDSQKAAAVNAVYDYASEQGKISALQDYDSNAAGWIKDATTDPMGAVVKKVVEADLSDAMGEMVSAWKNKHSDAEAKADLENVYAVYKSLSKETQKEIRENAGGRLGYFLTASESGVKADVFTELYKTYWDLDGSKSDASTKANRWAFTLERAQETGKITQAQKNTLKKEMNFVQVIPAEAKKFDELTSSGLSATDAQSVGRTVSYLMPEEGYKQVRDIQVIEQIAKMTLDDISKDAAMRSYMTDSQEEKLDTVLSMGYSPEEYAQIYRIIDGYTSGTGKKARTIAYLQDEYGISYGTAKTLYEVFK